MSWQHASSLCTNNNTSAQLVLTDAEPPEEMHFQVTQQASFPCLYELQDHRLAGKPPPNLS